MIEKIKKEIANLRCGRHMYGEESLKKYTFEVKEEPKAIFEEVNGDVQVHGFGIIHVKEVWESTCQCEGCYKKKRREETLGTVSEEELIEVTGQEYDEELTALFKS